MIYGTMSITMPLDLLEKIHDDVKSGAFRSKSAAVTEYAKIGIRISGYQDMLRDPKKAAEFQSKMQDIIHNEKLEGWLESMSTQQLDGLLGLMEIEKDKRYDQRRLN